MKEASIPHVSPSLRNVGLTLLVVAIGAALVWYISRPRERTQPAEAETPAPSAPDIVTLSPESLRIAGLQVEQVSLQPLRRPLRLFGQVEYLPQSTVPLNSRVTARVVQIRVRPGDKVRAGQVLAVLDSEEVLRAEMNYAQAKRQLAFAERELQRRRELAKLGAYASPALEEARARLVEAQRDVRNAEADYRSAQQALRSAEAGLRKAQVTLQNLSNQLQRAERLLGAQLVSQQEVDNLRAQHEEAQAEVQQNEAQVETARAALASAESRLQSAQQALEIAQQQAQRAERVYQQGYLTAKEVAEAEREYRLAQLELRSAEDALRLLGSAPGKGHTFTLTAPIDGEVVEVMASAGQTVTPDKPILRLVNSSAVWVALDIYPDDVPYVQPGLKVRLTTDAYPDRVFEATVQQVMPEAEEGRQVVRAYAVLSRAGGLLKPGMFVRAEGAAVISQAVIAVPIEAVQQVEGQPCVFLPVEGQEGTFRVRQVELGETVGNLIVIRSGLRSGERVVTRNASLVAAALAGAGVE